jgi:hypothetical protein
MVSDLVPAPDGRTQFAWSHHKAVPAAPGCYAIANYHGRVLYVGLATTSIRDRMGAHLDTPSKRSVGPQGVGFWFYYIQRPSLDVGPVERGWMNQALLMDGALPLLNRVYSPL